MTRTHPRLATVLTHSVLALTLLGHCTVEKESEWITELRQRAEQGKAMAQHYLGFM